MTQGCLWPHRRKWHNWRPPLPQAKPCESLQNHGRPCWPSMLVSCSGWSHCACGGTQKLVHTPSHTQPGQPECLDDTRKPSRASHIQEAGDCSPQRTSSDELQGRICKNKASSHFHQWEKFRKLPLFRNFFFLGWVFEKYMLFHRDLFPTSVNCNHLKTWFSTYFWNPVGFLLSLSQQKQI